MAELTSEILKEINIDLTPQLLAYFQKYFLQVAKKDKDGTITYDEFKKICWDCVAQG